ncbi:MAG: GMC family oxidoreductase N-terminal domain-containing protein, partial [Planctomycetes bacterium]|nr:GMC family oxidoreductase N-terminal domain-containing protein [Planctomycetota bacterium]
MPSGDYDYIIVGAGAGGAPLAARLAALKYRVLLLDAGGWEEPGSAQVPALHPLSTEHPELSWEFFVRHYTNDALQKQDSKWVSEKDGIFYPRASTVGGCTLHNALITIAGPAADWDDLADLTDDDSWCGNAMRPYFQRLERCAYQERPKGFDPGMHGFDGWLTTSWPDITLALKDPQLFKTLKAVFKASSAAGIETPWMAKWDFFRGRIKEHFDPNFERAQRNSPEGLAIVPIAVNNGKRSSPRDLLRIAQERHGEYLTVLENALAVKICLERTDATAAPSAVGVKYRRGRKLYKADMHPQTDGSTEELEIRCRREVILCGGAFNTPQLLMLSGIGPAEELQKQNIQVEVDLAGVGKNLQDRYEAAVIHEMPPDFSILASAAFREPGTVADPAYDAWQKNGAGIYASNGVVIGVFKRSNPNLAEPDLFIFALPGYFKGYQPKYSEKLAQYKNRLTWAILKAHTNNHEGSVTLRSKDPLEPPEINFRFFGDGKTENSDLDALVSGVHFVREIMAHVPSKSEEWPGNDEDLRDWIRREAWGHHACGTCRLGRPDDPLAVVDSRFRVRNVAGLRIVDASIFPKIPGFFIVTNIYMASEKAADVIHEDNNGGRDDPFYPRALASAESAAIAKRRKQFEADEKGTLDEKAGAVALALSGGGIRSATFNLGVIQALAKRNALGLLDYLSTVSGGGYIGSFLGALFTRLSADPIRGQRPYAAAKAILTDPDSKPLVWLRKNANFVSPTGKGNLGIDIGTYLRSFLTLHFILLVFLFLWYGLANAARFGLFPWFNAQVQALPLR